MTRARSRIVLMGLAIGLVTMPARAQPGPGNLAATPIGSLAWDVADPATATEAAGLVYGLMVGPLAPVPATGVTCTGTTPVITCVAPFPQAALANLPPGIPVSIAVNVVTPLGTSAPSAPLVYTPAGAPVVIPPIVIPPVQVATCGYLPTTGVGPMTQRPVGALLEGTNPVPQGARIAQLRAWGWRVESTMVDAKLMHVIAWCVGDPQ